MPLRVVSLLPSATEIVCALGAREQLVGVSHECDHPPDVAGLPVLTSTRVPPSPASGAIDRDVRRVLRDALAVYDVDVEGLERARPDVIVTQDLCDVCAVSRADVERAVRELASPAVEIVDLRPTRLDDIRTDLRTVARAIGRDDDAARVLDDFDRRLEAVRERAARAASRPAVLTIEWLDPVMAGGTWMPELVELAGGRPLVTRPGDPAPTLDPGALAALDPDVVLVKPCGFPLERTLSERALLEGLFARLGWPRSSVWLADGNAFFNRPGPRIVDSLEILSACVHPELFGDLAERHAGSFVRLDRA